MCSHLMAFYLSQSQGQVLTGLILGLPPWVPLLTLWLSHFLLSHPYSLHSSHLASSLGDFIGSTLSPTSRQASEGQGAPPIAAAILLTALSLASAEMTYT